MGENEAASLSEGRLSRRQVGKGLVWAAPVVAATAAAPMIAASGLRRYRAYVTASGRTKGMYILNLPADATDISFTVVGGGGAGSSGERTQLYPGGAGQAVTGTLGDGARGQTLLLTAGAGGGVAAGTATDADGGQGFGNGGATTGLERSGNRTHYVVRGGGGGGGSALQVVGGDTQLIAGGGGGGGGYAFLTTGTYSNSTPAAMPGGAAEADGGFPRHTYTSTLGAVRLALNPAPGSQTGRGHAASADLPGAVPTEIAHTISGGEAYTQHGAAGAAGNLATGADGATAPGDAWNGLLLGQGTESRFIVQGGGGGGGWAGGGSGAVRVFRQNGVSAWFSVPGSGGGGGSSYTAGSLVASSSKGHAGNAGAVSSEGGAGSVEILFSSEDYDLPGDGHVTQI